MGSPQKMVNTRHHGWEKTKKKARVLRLEFISKGGRVFSRPADDFRSSGRIIWVDGLYIMTNNISRSLFIVITVGSC